MASISYATSWDIATLIQETGEKKLSLRDMIMAIKSKTDAQLFRCVNIDTRGGGVIFTYGTIFESEARDIVSQLASYLTYIHGKDILKSFTPAAAERANAAPWDNKKKCAIAEIDRYLDDANEEVDGMTWVKAPKIEIEINNNVEKEAQPQQVQQDINHYNPALFADDKSIESFRKLQTTVKQRYEKFNTNKTNTPTKSKTSPKSAENDLSELSDTKTVATLSTRISQMDKHMDQMNNTMEKMSTGFEKMLDIFQSSAMTRQASTKDNLTPQADTHGGGGIDLYR